MESSTHQETMHQPVCNEHDASSVLDRQSAKQWATDGWSF